MGFDYTKIKVCGVLSESGEHRKEVSIVSWNNQKPKLDIRTWLPTGKPGKGVSLDKGEMEKLKELLCNIENEITL